MSLFHQHRAPTPPTFGEALRRANTALPGSVQVKFRPFLAGRRRNPRPYRVLEHGRDVGGSASLEGALFAALGRARSTAHA